MNTWLVFITNVTITLSGLLFDVSMNVEIEKHCSEEDSSWRSKHERQSWIATVAVHHERRLNEDHHELNDLHDCQILLNPEIFLKCRTDGSSKVVEIHEHVDEKIQRTDE